ncbi:uncharacterized protein HD556DRAFT_1364311 [Suillus plorans]|uniref:CxC2-like cysteine cluster KDZ transposase-associated domain-containing protein n=1 Tax=Suillus plorans TaxID=116603 RepID=A0A9P7ATQ7_9AGAM|nr:uncharacterized protein HD556DRAFT_1364311 [Suillus plorans]KAG1795293.1 hypothetical protein HD556DRAFT_1364311 [Suillus plorans]
MVIVDKSGVHRLEIRCCECPNAMSPDIQMFRHRFFPASFNRPKTVLECGTSAMNYYSKLRRMTSSMFPHLVPDRYRELMRVARQWRQLKTMKWHGFGHRSDNPSTGELALFCPAVWKYTRSFVMDRNFKAEHLHPIKPFDEVWLSDGLGFMVGKDRYKMHLAEAADTVEKSSCNNHRAVNQANAARHKLESTGIGGVACARHGCFVPHSMVDFQKGEKASHIHHSPFTSFQHNMEGITRAVTFYDINCQYNKHFRVRVDRSRFLEMAPQLTIIPGIGCYVRYASNFIEGIGRIDGEIMETLWARLNLISPAARGMNGILENSMKQHPSHLKTEWLARERIAQSSRLNDPSAMDEYEINIKKGKKEIELRLLEEGTPACSTLSRSVATWISTGLAIEEAQIALLIEVRRIGRRSTETQRLDIARQRDRLQGQIDGFARDLMQMMNLKDWDVDILDDLDDDPADFTETSHTWTNSPELTVIPLPSNLGVDRCRRCMAEDLIPLEMSLREGQANDALHNLRIYLCNKAILFRTTVRQAKSQALKTRAWSQVTTAVGDPNARGQRNESLAWFWSVEVDLGECEFLLACHIPRLPDWTHAKFTESIG